jgi:hypothetical protein
VRLSQGCALFNKSPNNALKGITAKKTASTGRARRTPFS